MLFYSALHYVEAFLTKKSAVYRDHQGREGTMRRWEETRRIFAQYDVLRKAAHEARYEGSFFRPADVAGYQRLHDAVRDEMLKAVAPGA